MCQIFTGIYLQHGTDAPLLEGIKMDDTLTIIELLSDRVKYMFEILSVSDKYLEVTDEASLDKVGSANIFN